MRDGVGLLGVVVSGMWDGTLPVADLRLCPSALRPRCFHPLGPFVCLGSGEACASTVLSSPEVLTLTARQTRLVEGVPLQAVYLHVLTTFTDQTAKTVDTVHFWSDRLVSYDFDDTGTQRQFLPYVLQATRDHVVRMPHLPTGSSFRPSLVRDYDVTLRNVTPQGGTNLLADLRAQKPEFSTLEVAELLLDPAIPGGEDLEDLTGDEHIIVYRGELRTIHNITREQFDLAFSTTRLSGVLPAAVVGSTVALRDRGKRLPAVYGEVQRVPLLGVVVGAQTTLSQPMPVGSTQISLSDPELFNGAGTVYVGGERMTWNGKTENVLRNVVREPAFETDHNPGEVVVEVPAGGVVYALGEALLISELLDIWMRSPETGELFKLNDTGSFTPNDTVSLPGHALTTVTWSTTSWADLLQEIIANARITQQPGFEDPADPTTTTTDQEDFNTNKRTIKNGEEGWSSPGKADGGWDEAARVFTYNRTSSDRKLACNVDTPLPSPNRDPERARLRVACSVTLFENIERAEVRVQVFPKPVNDDPLWSALAPISQDIVGGIGTYEFFGPYLSNPERSGAVDDSTTDELTDHELHVFFRVREGRGGGPFNFQAQVTALEIEYDYISGGTLIPINTAVEIAGFSGGAGVELYADVLGPVVPASTYSLGYDFPSGETWDVSEVTQSDVTGGIKLVSDATIATRLSLLSDATNWTPERLFLSVSDDASPPTGMTINCLRLDFDFYQAVAVFADLDWSGTATDNENLADNKLDVSITVSSTEHLENTGLIGSPVDMRDRWLHFPLINTVSTVTFATVDIRVGSSAVDYWTFRYNMTEPFAEPIDIRMNGPLTDPAFLSTTGTPDASIIDRIRITWTAGPASPPFTAGLSRLTGIAADTGPGLVLPDDGAIGSNTDLDRTFAAQDWSADDEVRFLIHRNVESSTLTSIQFSISDGSQFLIYVVDISEIPEETATLLTFNFGTPTDDPHFAVNTGLNKAAVTDLRFTIFVIDNDTPLPVNDPVIHIENVETVNAPGGDLNAQVAPAATTDLDNTSAEYELDFLVREPNAVGEVVLQFSNDAPTYPAGPTDFREIRFSPGAFEDGETNTAVRFTASTTGTPADLDDINVIRIDLESETSGGFEIELYALRKSDDNSDYKAAGDALIEHPADVMRHILQQRLLVPFASIDATTWDAAETNLGDNQVSVVLNELGLDFYAITGRLGFEHRFQVVSEEAASVTEYRMLTAQATYDFPTTTTAIDREGVIRENAREAESIQTRFRELYDPDRGGEIGGLTDGFRKSLRADADVNDISADLATSVFTNAELRFGLQDGPNTALDSIVDDDTASDRLAYFATELMRETGNEFVVVGVPALQAYALQRGDIILLTPDWGSQVSVRVVGIVKHTTTLTFDLTCIQVETS